MNKQIEEMAKDIYEQKSCDTSFEENCKLLAYDLVTLGYQKVDKDKVVIDKTEYERLIYVEGELQEMNADYYNELKELKDSLKDSVVLTREEYDNLKLEIQKAHNKGVRVGFDLTKYKENSIEQAVKEFAEKLRKNLYSFKCETIIYDSELSNLAKEIYIKQLDFIKERMIEETLKEVIGEKE